MMYWQKDVETMNRSDLDKLQLQRLKSTIESAINSPFYGKLFKELEISSDSIQSTFGKFHLQLKKIYETAIHSEWQQFL